MKVVQTNLLNLSKVHENKNNLDGIKSYLSECNKKDKMKYLHRMLDNQIQTVKNMFEGNNALQQISTKLKELQIKLNSIKEEQSNHVKKTRQQIHKGSNHKEHPVKLTKTFQSINEYNTNEKVSIDKKKCTNYQKQNSNQILIKSINNFSSYHENQNCDHSEAQNHISKKNSHSSVSVTLGHRKSSQTISKVQNISKWSSRKGKSKSKDKPLEKEVDKYKTHKNLGKLLQRKSQKKQEKEKKQRAKSCAQELIHSKTATQINIFTKTPVICGKDFNKRKTTILKAIDDDHQNKVRQIKLQNETKKLQKQLSNYKLKNQSLRVRVKELKCYKKQYDKLKNIFDKDQTLKKNRITK